jgi:excisionase family DNA binding protein
MTEMLLTVEQAAERLQIHPTSVRRQLQGGRLRGVKRGRLWRVPESALLESTPRRLQPGRRMTIVVTQTAAQSAADAIWRDMTSGNDKKRDAALSALTQTSDAARAIVMQKSAEVAARYYATPEGEAELADWRALDGEPFHED